MLKLLKKEILLSMHPIAPISLILSILVIFPDYPYIVIFSYTTLALFFTCLSGRENNDVIYSLTLPIEKKDIVKSRFLLAVVLQLSQLIITAFFILLSRKINPVGNRIGMDANSVLIAEAFFLYGLFNLTFFTGYYKNVTKVGTSFVVAASIFSITGAIFEVCTHTVPFVRDYLDTLDPLFMPYKLTVSAGAVLMYILFTTIAYKKSVVLFEKQDL